MPDNAARVALLKAIIDAWQVNQDRLATEYAEREAARERVRLADEALDRLAQLNAGEAGDAGLAGDAGEDQTTREVTQSERLGGIAQ